jgi:hypothetical protein
VGPRRGAAGPVRCGGAWRAAPHGAVHRRAVPGAAGRSAERCGARRSAVRCVRCPARRCAVRRGSAWRGGGGRDGAQRGGLGSGARCGGAQCGKCGAVRGAAGAARDRVRVRRGIVGAVGGAGGPRPVTASGRRCGSWCMRSIRWSGVGGLPIVERQARREPWMPPCTHSASADLRSPIYANHPMSDMPQSVTIDLVQRSPATARHNGGLRIDGRHRPDAERARRGRSGDRRHTLDDLGRRLLGARR